MTGYIDAHNHLQDPRLDTVRSDVLQQLASSSYEAMVVNGTCEQDWAAVAQLAENSARIIPAYGLHPWRSAQRSAHWLETLETFLKTPRATLGEVGLDKWMRNADIQDQREVLELQLSLATRFNLPVTIHCLQAWGHLKEVLTSTSLPSRGLLIHAYSGPSEMLSTFLDCGAYFSFSGYFLHDRKVDRRELFAKLPENRLLVETDSPDMCLPDQLDHHRHHFSAPINHPGNIEVIYRHLAEIRGCPLSRLMDSVADNFHCLFH